jgi:hypothetical protein
VDDLECDRNQRAVVKDADTCCEADIAAFIELEFRWGQRQIAWCCPVLAGNARPSAQGFGGLVRILLKTSRPERIRVSIRRQGVSKMSPKRSIAFWELCRQGLPLLADAASECWERGKRFELGDVQVAQSLKELIDQCNWEIERPINSH